MMKKTLLTLLTALALLATLAAVPRNLVVVEVATGTWCQYCPGAAMGCHDLLANSHPVAIIKNHDGDTFANVYSNARNSFYNPSGVPTAWFDGRNPYVGGSNTNSLYGQYLAKVNARKNVPSHFTLSASGSMTGNQIDFEVKIAKPEDDSNTNVMLHAVITESHIPKIWQNQTTVENVNRLMIPDQNGTPISLATGDSTTVDLSFTANPAWVLNNLEVVIFLQNMTTKEILQGAKYSVPGLTGAYPVSHDYLDFPDTYLTGSTTIPITISNYLATPASGTISINNPVFVGSIEFFEIPGNSSIMADICFVPEAAQTYEGILSITSNLNNHNNINIPLSGTGFINAAPTVANVVISGPPVWNQELTATYEFNDTDGDSEGNSGYQWYRMINNQPEEIEGADGVKYVTTELDLGWPLAVEVIPVDEHGMAGTPVMSVNTIPIEELPPPQNLQAQLTPPHNVVLTWEPPQYFGGKAFLGYRVFRDGTVIATLVTVPNLTYTDADVEVGAHEYWVCSVFSNPMMTSNPSNVVTVDMPVANDDQIAPAEISVSVSPNPFQSSAGISIQSKAGAEVEFAIYNIRGQLVKDFDLTADQAGTTNFAWDGTDRLRNRVNSGIYHYQMRSAGRLINGRIVLMK